MSSDFPPPGPEEQQWLVNFIIALDDASIAVSCFEDILSRPLPIPTSSRQPNADILKAYEIARELLLDVEEDYKCVLREAAEMDVDLRAFEVPPMRDDDGCGLEESGMVESLPRGEIQSRILEVVREVRLIQKQIGRVDGEVANRMRQ